MSESKTYTSTLNDDQIIDFTQGIREAVVKDVVKDGLPDDEDNRAFLMETLRDMDRTSLGRMKVNTKERELDINQQTQMALQRLTATFGGSNPFQAGQVIDSTAVVAEEVVPKLAEDALPQIELVEGETNVGVEEIRYDAFMQSAVEKGIAKPLGTQSEKPKT